MSIASASTSDLAADLAPLVPRRSPARNVALTLAVLLVLAAVWFSPALLRPALDPGPTHAGTGSAVVGQHQVLTVIEIQPFAWPSATLLGVDPIDGADVGGAWLLPIPDDGSFPATDDPSDLTDAVAGLRSAYPGADVEPGGSLPHTFRSGERLHLAILWDILDCTALRPGDVDSAGYAYEELTTTATVRNALGTTSTATLWDGANPGNYPWDSMDLDSALCP